MSRLFDVFQPREPAVTAGIQSPRPQLRSRSYQLIRATEDCQIYMGLRDAGGVTPIRIECQWPGIGPAAVETLFDQFDGYHTFVWALSNSRVERVEPRRTLVWQRHEVPGTAARETLVWLRAEDNSAGSRRYTWTTAADEALVISRRALRAPRNDGMWNITPTALGVDVTLELAYDPGGMVPDWLVRWCQTLGADRMMSEIRARASASAPRQSIAP